MYLQVQTIKDTIMKRIFVLGLFSALFMCANAQEVAVQKTPKPMSELAKPYDESLDGMQQIADAVAKAKAEGKMVMCQVGGNWCKWCLWFADFITTDEDVKAVVDANYEYIHVNFSPKNKNEKAFEFFGNPKLGYPFFVVIDAEGKLEGVYESACLEEGQGYSKEKVIEFFMAHAPKHECCGHHAEGMECAHKAQPEMQCGHCKMHQLK